MISVARGRTQIRCAWVETAILERCTTVSEKKTIYKGNHSKTSKFAGSNPAEVDGVFRMLKA